MEAAKLAEILGRNERADLLRLNTAGSVDDGKSTLIGRLLYDSKSILEDQLDTVQTASKRLNRDTVDLALLMDGLKSEREQGITIDVAYRYFSTSQRRFIIADSPGHEQYTRNMVTGASTAELSIILLDAKRGLTTQSRRHAFIASLLRVPHVVVVVNKMDLVDWSRDRFEELRSEFETFAQKLELTDITFIPVSALLGDCVVDSGTNMPWYEGPTLLSHLESVYVGGGRNLIDLRLPVQLVNRPTSDFRGYCGTIRSGVLRVGDQVMVLPSGRTSHVESIVTLDGNREFAFAPQSITVTLTDEIDVSRGDMFVHPGNQPQVQREADAMLVWMDEAPLRPGAAYFFRHCSSEVRGVITELRYRVDPDNLHRHEASELGLNEIGRARVELHTPLMMDEYARNRATGAFVLIDPLTNRTVGAGMIQRPGRPPVVDPASDHPASSNITRHEGAVTAADRRNLLRGQKPATLWFTGLSGAGKSTVAFAVERLLMERGFSAYVLDGDNLRHGLNRDLGFTPAERRENIRRVAEVARLMNQAGLIVITSFISPYLADRKHAREVIGDGFVEVFVDAPLEVCEGRDPKGLYKRARSGEITDFTGVSAPYEAPVDPDMHLHTDRQDAEALAQKLVENLIDAGILPAEA